MRNSEHELIGCVLEIPESFYLVSDRVTPEMFSDSLCRAAYETFLDFTAQSIPIDLIRVQREIKHVAELSTMMSQASGNIESHANVIIDNYCHRELNRSAKEILTVSNSGLQAMDLLNKKMLELENSITRGHIESIGQVISDIYRKGSSEEYVKTGFTHLDKIIGGWTNTDLVIIAGRPAMGKTAFALSAAKNLIDKGIPVGFFSLEMSSRQLVNRIRSMASRVNGNKLSKGQPNEKEIQTLLDVDDNLRKSPLYIEDRASLNIFQFRSEAIKLVRKHKVKVIFVDYLQLMAGSGQYKGNKVQEVTEISRMLKQVAKELKVPVIALAQLSRNVESRADKKPMLSDLRDSGAIEQDADIVTFLYRPDYYGIDIPEGQHYPTLGISNVPVEGTANILIEKHRAGALADIPFYFNKETTHFTDYVREYSQVPF